MVVITFQCFTQIVKQHTLSRMRNSFRWRGDLWTASHNLNFHLCYPPSTSLFSDYPTRKRRENCYETCESSALHAVKCLMQCLTGDGARWWFTNYAFQSISPSLVCPLLLLIPTCKVYRVCIAVLGEHYCRSATRNSACSAERSRENQVPAPTACSRTSGHK